MNFTSDFLLVLIFKGSWEPQCPGAPGAPGALGAPGAPGAPNHELELCQYFSNVSNVYSNAPHERIHSHIALGRGPKQKNGKIVTQLSFFTVFNHKNDLEKV